MLCRDLGKLDRPSRSTVLLGDSHIRKFDGFDDIDIKSFTGFDCRQVRTVLEESDMDHWVHYDNWIVVLGSNGVKRRQPEGVYGNMRRLVRKIFSINSDAQVIIYSIFPILNNFATTDHKIKFINMKLQRWVLEETSHITENEKKSIRYIDFQRNLVKVERGSRRRSVKSELYEDDGLHLNPFGSKKLGESIVNECQCFKLLKILGDTNLLPPIFSGVEDWVRDAHKLPYPRLPRERFPGPCEVLYRVQGPTCIASNFYESPVCFMGLTLSSVEKWYQVLKAIFSFQYALAMLMIDIKDPFQLKRLAATINQKDGWDKRKVQVLVELLQCKYDQCEEFRYQLMYCVGRKFIVHTVKHLEWGMYEENNYLYGSNLFGRILSHLRYINRH